MVDITKVRVELSKMNCRVHLKLPRITKTGEELHFDTCCDDFEKKLETRYAELLQDVRYKSALGKLKV